MRSWCLGLAWAVAACGGGGDVQVDGDSGGAIVRVRLTDTTPVPGCRARILGGPWHAECDEDGVVRFSGVWTGDWDVEVTAVGEGLLDLAPQNVVVPINPGVFSDVNATLFLAGGAHGHVMGAPGPVNALIASGSSFAATDALGLYFLPDLAPGVRRFQAFYGGGVITRDGITILEGEISIPVDFASGWQSGNGEVDGTLVVGTNKPAAIGIQAINTRTGEQAASLTPTGEGRELSFAFSAEPGAYMVRVHTELSVGEQSVDVRVSRMVFVSSGAVTRPRLSLPTPDMIDPDLIGDLDQDGIADSIDLATFDPSPAASIDSDQNSLPDSYDFTSLPGPSDRDGDGFTDEADNCPDTHNTDQDPLACRDCLADTDCTGAGENACVNETCVECDDDAHCPGLCNLVVNQCVECFNDLDCPSVCNETTNQCVECTQDNECSGMGQNACVGETCVECSSDLHCTTMNAPHCQLSDNTCYECVDDDDCEGGNSCVDNACVSTADKAVALGLDHTCALRAGDVYCWGGNNLGQLGDGGVLVSTHVPTLVSGLPPVATLSAGSSHTCVVTAEANQRVFCWGKNSRGECGQSGMTTIAAPMAVSGLPAGDLLDIALGGGHSCVLTGGNGVWCWGSNDSGQLGRGTAGPGGPTPAGSVGTSGATVLTAGGDIVCIDDGSGDEMPYKCWGNNEFGAFGDGAPLPAAPSLVPKDTLNSIGLLSALSHGTGHTCGVSPNGVVCWGLDSHLQIANTQVNSSNPINTFGSAGTLDAVAIGNHSCGVDIERKLWCWGANQDGQLGLAGSGDTPVNPLDDVTVLPAGGTGASHTCVYAGETLWCWGRNTKGQSGVPSGDPVAPTVVSFP